MTIKEERPAEPKSGSVMYRGWEAGWEESASMYTKEAWVAYLGGVDLDARQHAADSWEALLDLIDEEEDEKFPHCQPSDIFETTDDASPEVIERIRSYLATFTPAKIVKGKRVCINCGQHIDSFRHQVGLAVAFRWGLAHGEASCSGCNWPARGMHYIKDEQGKVIMQISNVFLEYHPSFVSIGPKGSQL